MNNLKDLPFGLEPDLNAEYEPHCTWGEKKRLCESEAFSYWSDDVPITQNPYFENTWPWKWFNDAYLKLVHDARNEFQLQHHASFDEIRKLK